MAKPLMMFYAILMAKPIFSKNLVYAQIGNLVGGEQILSALNFTSASFRMVAISC